MNSVPNAHLSRQRRIASQTAYSDVFDPTEDADESLFWAFDGDQMDTPSFVCNEAAMILVCRKNGLTYRLAESSEQDGNEPTIYQILKADGSHEAWMVRQHADLLRDMNRTAELTDMSGPDMMPSEERYSDRWV